MKTTILQCDVCHREYNEDTLNYTSIYEIKNGSARTRIDLCPECAEKLIVYLDTDHPTEKGSVQE